MLSNKIVYVQKGNLGYLSDQEWDGDSFVKNPHDAIKRDKPWSEGRMAQQYTCVKLELLPNRQWKVLK